MAGAFSPTPNESKLDEWKRKYPFVLVLHKALQPLPDRVDKSGKYGEFCRLEYDDLHCQWRFPTAFARLRFKNKFGGKSI